MDVPPANRYLFIYLFYFVYLASQQHVNSTTTTSFPGSLPGNEVAYDYYLKRRWPSGDRSYNLEQNKIEKQTPLPSPEIKFEDTRKPIFFPSLIWGEGVEV